MWKLLRQQVWNLSQEMVSCPLEKDHVDTKWADAVDGQCAEGFPRRNVGPGGQKQDGDRGAICLAREMQILGETGRKRSCWPSPSSSLGFSGFSGERNPPGPTSSWPPGSALQNRLLPV